MAVPDLWRGPPLVLASTSTTRRKLLDAVGLSFEIQAPGVDERAVQAALPDTIGPAELAGELAAAKALAVSRVVPDALVIGADQVLTCGGELYAKPADRDAAHAQISRLAGRPHELHSAVAIARAGATVACFAETATLAMRALAPEAISIYLEAAGDAAFRSVGGYEIEGLGLHLFERVAGDHSVILGLPMLPLLAELRRLGFLAI